MKSTEYFRRLQKAGCYIQREGSSHTIWHSPITGKTFSIGRHQSKELSKGLYHEAVKTLGVK